MKSVCLSILALFIFTVTQAQYHCTVQSFTGSTVTFRTTGYGKKAAAAAAEAELNALRTLLFAGAPGTNYSTPLIAEGRQEAETKYADAFNELYGSAYRDFIETSITVTAFGKDAEKRKCTTLDVCIRAQQLRSWLERKGVIRRFGL